MGKRKKHSQRVPKQLSGVVAYAERRISEGKYPTEAQFMVLRALASDGNERATSLLRECFSGESNEPTETQYVTAPRYFVNWPLLTPLLIPLAFAVGCGILLQSFWAAIFAFAFATKDLINVYAAIATEAQQQTTDDD